MSTKLISGAGALAVLLATMVQGLHAGLGGHGGLPRMLLATASTAG